MAQFAYPRNSTNPATYTSARSSSYRQKRALKIYGPPVAGLIFLIWLFTWLTSGALYSTTTTRPGGGKPEVVIVTTFDPRLSEAYKEGIKENRIHYAQRHGYATFFPNTTDYDLMPKIPTTWSVVPAMRHAMTLYPHSSWVWYLSSSAVIMNTQEALHTKVLEPRTLEGMMITNEPVVPPDSVIKTFSHVKGERVDLVIGQDFEGLAADSMVVRTGEWAKFFLDAWFDPLYRSYHFQKEEKHALEHLVQWHGTVLTKLGMVPQRELNSYTRESGMGPAKGFYQDGDLVANAHGCLRLINRNCEEEMAPLLARSREIRDQKKA